MLDVLIRNGTIVDGTGADPFVADVAIRDGKIVAMGDVDEPAKRTIDATGLHVMPGFIDIHTHYDGQASWDETFTPSIYHGVTTLVMGNCGVGFAPVRPGDRDVLIDLMEGVEEIPGTALSEGMTWNWETFTDYGRALDAMPHSLDFMTLVPHDCLRLYVMGERAARGEPANDVDIAMMQALLRQALVDGAAGLAMGSTETHRTAGGNMTPSFEVSPVELNALASVLRDLPYRVIQGISDFASPRGTPEEEQQRFDREYAKLEDMARLANRPISITWMDRVIAPRQSQWLGDASLASAEKGITVRLQASPRGIGVLNGLDTTLNLLAAFPSYQAISHLPAKERAQKLREPETRAKILSEKPVRLSVEGSSIPPLADYVVANFEQIAFTLFPLIADAGGSMDYEPLPSSSFGAQAKARGVSARELMYDHLAGGDGSNLVYFPIHNYLKGSLDRVREMMLHPNVLCALGDGGAHVGTICDASITTSMLAHWGVQRTRGPKIPLPQVVNMLTQRNAAHMGLADRGVIAAGMKADINVVDLDRLALPMPEIVRDLPQGGRRMVQKSHGYVATLVSGIPVIEQGEITPARPGRWTHGPRAN
ncbi:MAG: amidohydrolase family protein [Burkholderiales bacterium]|nr:amidohydrolase family protein [Burkholderiales bacterium]